MVLEMYCDTALRYSDRVGNIIRLQFKVEVLNNRLLKCIAHPLRKC